MRPHPVIPATTVAFALAFIVGCGQDPKQTITLAGSTSVQPFAERLAEEYMARHPGVEINVQGGGSSAGIRAVGSGICQLGMSSRRLTPEEGGLYSVTMAHDGIVLVVNRANPMRDLTIEQARVIFSGGIRYWDEVGGPHLRITAITREEGSGTRASFEEKVMRPDGIEAQPITADALVQDSNGSVREIVATDPAAIGYISLGLVDERVRALNLDGVVPEHATIRSGRYPLSREFLLLSCHPPEGLAKSFVDYALSPEGQRLLAEEGLTTTEP